VAQHGLEWAALLECAAPELNEARFAELLHEKLDWTRLLALAREHGLTGLLAARVGELNAACVPQNVRHILREKRREQSVFGMSLTGELFRLLEKFSAAGLEAIVMKGPVLSVRAYGDAGIRRYEDVDLLVRQEEIPRFVGVLAAEGYRSKLSAEAIGSRRVPGEYLFWWPKTTRRIELHTERTLRYLPQRLAVEELFARRVSQTVDAQEVPALCVEDELALVCVHNAKHFWERLCWIADVAALIRRQENLDWPQVLRTVRSAGAERMLLLGVRLAAEVLRLRVPKEMEEAVRSDKGTARMAKDIIWRLPLGRRAARGLLGRAAFRMRMRGGMFSGAAYLLRLALSPTEEDWNPNEEKQRLPVPGAIQRPLRLAQKYWRKND